MRQPHGQNFLVDHTIIRRIILAGELAPGDSVIEVGPGKGALTAEILPLVKSLTAVEIDPKLADGLAHRYGADPRFTLVNRDFLKFDLPDAAHPYKVLANLPYNMATAILEKLLPSPGWERAVIMVQKEVAERIAGNPGTRAYGSFSVFAQYYADSSILFTVGPGCFHPRPKVDSAVLLFTNRHTPAPDADFFPLVRACFQQRRKTLVNSLAANSTCPKETIAGVLENLQINTASRAENLGIQDYLRLTEYLKKCIIFKLQNKNEITE